MFTPRRVAPIVLGLLLATVVAACSIPEPSSDTPAGADQATGDTSQSKGSGGANTKPAGTVLLSVKGSGTKSTKKSPRPPTGT